MHNPALWSGYGGDVSRTLTNNRTELLCARNEASRRLGRVVLGVSGAEEYPLIGEEALREKLNLWLKPPTTRVNHWSSG